MVSVVEKGGSEPTLTPAGTKTCPPGTRLVNGRCVPDDRPPREFKGEFRSGDTGRPSGIVRDDRTFLGLGPEDVDTIRADRRVTPPTPQEVAAGKVLTEGPRLEQQFEEAGVFRDISLEPIISPEQENLGVIGRIFNDITGGKFDTSKGILGDKSALTGTLFGKNDKPISQAEITMIEADIKAGIRAETLVQIDDRIEETEELLIQNGIPLVGILGTAIIAQAVIKPTAEFVGTDGQIKSLELALSQYNEMITIPSRSLDAGVSVDEAFARYNRMEDSLLALESQLQLSALTSPKVAISLKGRGIDARLFKLKSKLQEGREIVAFRASQEALGEVDVPKSLVFLRDLIDKRSKLQ